VFFIIWAIFAGLIIGSIAKLFVPGRQNIPIWLTILIGVAGALIGNFLAVVLGVRHTFGIDWIRHSLQVATAVVLLSLVLPTWSRRTPG
jgi:uncharacterized membrane protein YeaQ/YmgE (transglycosylase-associated protein family)